MRMDKLTSRFQQALADAFLSLVGQGRLSDAIEHLELGIEASRAHLRAAQVHANNKISHLNELSSFDLF